MVCFVGFSIFKIKKKYRLKIRKFCKNKKLYLKKTIISQWSSNLTVTTTKVHTMMSPLPRSFEGLW